MNASNVVCQLFLFFCVSCEHLSWSFLLVRLPYKVVVKEAPWQQPRPAAHSRWNPTFAKKRKSPNDQEEVSSGANTVALEDDNDDDDDGVDVHHVSEATALLACRAYLQRKHRLGPWNGWQERQSRRQAAVATGGVGFFWEDPTELRFYSPHKRRRAGDVVLEQPDGEDVSNDDATLALEPPTTRNSRRRDRSSDQCDDLGEDSACSVWELASFPHTLQEDEIMDELCDETTVGDEDDDDEPDALEEGSHASTSPSAYYDEFPPETHLRRSQAARVTWSDPLFRERWYKSRWSSKKEKPNPEEGKLRRSSGTPFPMEEVAAMTEDEITHAIRSYVSSKQRRRVTKKQNTREPSDSPLPNEPKLTYNSLLPNEELLKQRRQARSLRAAKAYKNRVEKQPQTSKSVNASSSRFRRQWDAPTGDQPSDAQARIECALVAGELPCVEDIELILRPTRLSRRKDTLRRVLDSLGFRGKCLPPLAYLMDESNFDLESVDSSELSFVTQGGVDHLGAFCIGLLRQRR